MGGLGYGRRRHVRGDVRVTALLAAKGVHSPEPYLVHNLSAGGALLIGEPCPPIGEDAAIELQLPEQSPLRLHGVVLRVQERFGAGHSFAVSFRDVPADLEDRIHDTVLAALQKSRAAGGSAVLVMVESAEDRRGLEQHLKALRRVPEAAQTPLDALRWLQGPRVRVDAAVVDERIGPTTAPAVLRFLAEDFPAVRRVLIVHETDHLTSDVARWPSHAVLRKPWDQSHLARALGQL
jgi:hypothetical protein